MAAELAGGAAPRDPAEALELLRNTAAPQLAPVIARIDAASSGWSDIKFRARLNAYRTIATYVATGEVRPLAKGSAEATVEINEYEQALHFDVARVIAKEYAERWPSTRQFRTYATMFRASSKTDHPFRDDPSLDVQVIPATGATTTFMLFCGNRHRFGVSLNVMYHCWLAQLNANVIIIRDFSEAIYTAGIKSIGDDAASRERLRQILDSLGTRRLVCVGQSGGTFGALYYGAKLGADWIVNFSGPTSLDIGMEFEEKQFYPRVQKLHAEGKSIWPDIRELYERTPQTKARLFFAMGNVADRKQAEYLAGLPNVFLEPLPGTQQHYIIDDLVQRGLLEAVFAEAAGGTRTERKPVPRPEPIVAVTAGSAEHPAPAAADTGIAGIPLPPRELRKQNDQRYLQSAKATIARLAPKVPITASSQVLDIASGPGRLALPLSRLLKAERGGGYLGLDRNRAAIDWAHGNITAKFPHLRFEALQGGAPRTQLPAADGAFDLVTAFNIFAHMLPDGVTKMIAEAARCLKPGGTLYFTALIVDDDARAAIASGKAAWKFSHDLGDAMVLNPKRPLLAVGLSEAFVMRTAQANGLVLESIRRNAWREGKRGGLDGLYFRKS